MTYLLYFTAVSLSAVAAYYSIAGLTSIFAAAVIPIVVMGSVLEFSKLVVASWLYRNWKGIPFLMRSYFSFALVILMMLTSMGIFGYLSKAHLDQAVPTGDVSSKVSILDEKIKTEKENVEAARGQLKQMDAQVDQTMSRSDDSKGAERSLQIRRGQQKERTALLAEIGSAQTRIARLNEERAPIAAELRKVEAEVGPIKYIAALLYGDNPDQTILEKAVRIVIIMIVIVFDPLAVLLLMAANIPTTRREENGNTEADNKQETTSSAESPIQTSLNQIKESSNIIKERFFRRFKPTEKPVVVERTPESSSSGASTEASARVEPTIGGNSSDREDRSAGITSTTEDQSTWEIEKLVQVTHEQASDLVEHENVQLDSSARLNQVNTPVDSNLIVDWSNKDQKGAV